jgi:fumarylacetoacetase
MPLNHTHDASRRSWLVSANIPGTDFPIQNLPFCVFRLQGKANEFRGGVAIGDQIIDLAAVLSNGAFGADHDFSRAIAAAAQSRLNAFMSMGPSAWKVLRHGLFDALLEGAKGGKTDAIRESLVAQAQAEYALPSTIGDYTDFYTSEYHAANIGRLFRPGAEPLTPNFKWLPIAYHGRASSIGISGQRFHRPMGQFLPPPLAGTTAPAPSPVFGPCKRLDYELEIAMFVGPGNEIGSTIPLDRAEDHIFGICLLNDWSARDIQSWEYAPLGPFLGKNFASTISPWVVTMEALEPFRLAWEHDPADPEPLAYLDSPQVRSRGSLDIQLEVLLESAQRRALNAGPAMLSKTSFKHQYWTVAQMIAHHTVGGCNLKPGDLVGSGTISGPTIDQAGALIELSKAAREPITVSAPGAPDEQRGFLLDGDAVVLRGWCEREGFARIGFGECRGEVLPAKA